MENLLKYLGILTSPTLLLSGRMKSRIKSFLSNSPTHEYGGGGDIKVYVQQEGLENQTEDES